MKSSEHSRYPITLKDREDSEKYLVLVGNIKDLPDKEFRIVVIQAFNDEGLKVLTIDKEPDNES